jgi:hypothetical protein
LRLEEAAGARCFQEAQPLVREIQLETPAAQDRKAGIIKDQLPGALPAVRNAPRREKAPEDLVVVAVLAGRGEQQDVAPSQPDLDEFTLHGSVLRDGMRIGHDQGAHEVVSLFGSRAQARLSCRDMLRPRDAAQAYLLLRTASRAPGKKQGSAVATLSIRWSEFGPSPRGRVAVLAARPRRPSGGASNRSRAEADTILPGRPDVAAVA